MHCATKNSFEASATPMVKGPALPQQDAKTPTHSMKLYNSETQETTQFDYHLSSGLYWCKQQAASSCA
jgi:hypothetical protein